MMTSTCKFVAITQKLKLFWQNLLNNYYSTLHNLSDGIYFVKNDYRKKKWTIITPNNFTYCIPIVRNFNGEY